MEGLSKEYSMDQLPTAPVGKQQIIDLNAGAILRKENKKSSTFYGINPFLLLTVIMILKCGLLGGWLYREYQVFDFGCQMLRMGTDYIYQDRMSKVQEETLERRKRSLEMEEFSNQQGQRVNKQRPVLGSTKGALTTMVTMTNLQELPSGNSDAPIRMKTIRQRVEEVNRVPVDDNFEGSMEEPTIYISPIQSRHSPPIDDDQMATISTIKPKKKKKGKGNKKKNRSTPEPTTEKPKKKKKGLGRKKQRMLEQMKNRVATEQTKAPRHLMTSVGHTGPTPHPPAKGSFLEGGVEHQDSRNANKGHIRNFPMNKATKRPKHGIKLSEETKLMWALNEVNYTTQMHQMQVKTTEMTRENTGMSSFIDALPPPKPKEKQRKDKVTTEEPPPPLHEFYSSRASARPKNKEQQQRTSNVPTPVVVALRPENKVHDGQREDSTQVYQPVAIYYETVIEPGKKPGSSRLAQLEREYGYNLQEHQHSDEDKEYYIPPPPRKVKHGYDRGLDSAIDAGLADVGYKSTPKPRKIEDEEENERFKDELRSFTSNALCMVRTIFDTWCGCQILTAIPYLLGMCLARRNLFILHLICDILFLGGGFLFSITLLVLAVLLYVAVEGMSTAEFLQWLMFVFVIEASLIAYTLVVYICYQCTERIVLARQNGLSKTVPSAETV